LFICLFERERDCAGGRGMGQRERKRTPGGLHAQWESV